MYVLDPTFQQGRKLPKWQPHSCCGIFVGYSPAHSSDVLLNLNPKTGQISPQYQKVFDDSFSTVASIGDHEDPPSFWNEFDLNEFLYHIPLGNNAISEPYAEWLTPAELEERERQRV